MNEILTDKEKEWINKLLNVNFLDKEILIIQLNNIIEVQREEKENMFSLKFIIDRDIKKFPYKLRIPVEMNVYQSGDIPVSFLLHLKNGYIDELEIYTMDGSRLDYNSFNFNNIKHIINKLLIKNN